MSKQTQTIKNKWLGGKPSGSLRWNEKRNSWKVTFQGKHKKQKFFSVKKYGTKEAAYEAGAEFRKDFSHETESAKNRYMDMGDYLKVEVYGEGEMRFGKIDKEDLETFNKHFWHADKPKAKGKRYYMRTSIDGKHQRFHRLLYPECEMIDHINRNSLDNRRSNLRMSSAQDNNLNRCLQRNNTSGVNGVRFHKGHGRNKPRWQAIWKEGKRKTKSFSVDKYGNEKAKQMAIDFRKQVDKRLGIRNGYASE